MSIYHFEARAAARTDTRREHSSGTSPGGSRSAVAWATPSARELRRLVWPPRSTHRSRLPRTVRPYLVLGDLILTSLVALLVLAPGAWELVVLVTSVLVMLTILDTHRSRLTMSSLDDLPRLAQGALLGAAVQVTWWLAEGREVTSALIVFPLTLTAVLVVGRAVSYGAVREARRRGWVQHRVLVLGAGETGREIAQASLDHPEYGVRTVGFIDAGPVDDADSLPAPLLGGFDRLSYFVRREGVSEVIVAALNGEGHTTSDMAGEGSDLIDAVRDCDRLDCEIFYMPRFHELRHRSYDMDDLWGIPLVRARRRTWRSSSWMIKRIVDVLVSAAALLLLAPLMLAVAFAVRLEVGSSVLFRQVRSGLDGEPFTLLKFRSLSLPDAPDAEGGAPVVWSINGDDRLGPVGRFIRSTSIDELPQLLNILRGEMSLVGPRPERPEFVEEFSKFVPRYTARHRTPAGLTGWAQVNGLRGDTSIQSRVRFDNYYIQNWSLWLDVKIIARTVSSVLMRRGS